MAINNVTSTLPDQPYIKELEAKLRELERRIEQSERGNQG